MKIQTYPLCPVCREELETLYRFLGRWCATTLAINSVFVAYLTATEQLQKVTASALLQLAETPEIFVTFVYV